MLSDYRRFETLIGNVRAEKGQLMDEEANDPDRIHDWTDSLEAMEIWITKERAEGGVVSLIEDPRRRKET